MLGTGALVLFFACARGESQTASDDDVGPTSNTTGVGGSTTGDGGGTSTSSTGGAPECTTSDQCDDGDVCTTDVCATDTCQNTPVVCDDDLFCNGEETCDPVAGCQPGTPPEIDDDVTCTDDACDEEADIVVNTPNQTKCLDDSVCIESSTCDPVDDCVIVEESICADCTELVHDNGAFDSVDGVGATSWNLDGIIDEFAWPGGDLCGVAFEFVRDIAIVNEYQQVRVRIYDLAGGALVDLGLFGANTPTVDQTYKVSEGSLVISDTAVDLFGADVLTYETFGYTFSLPAGNYGIHVSFPDYVIAATGFWPTSAPEGVGECAQVWGANSPTMSDLCVAYGPQFDKLDFRMVGPI